MVLLVGLGNPGKRYEQTRHNFGFFVLQEIGRRYAVTWRRTILYRSFLAQVGNGDDRIILLMPQTMMNNSGIAVSKLAADRGIVPHDILAVCDDLNLPFGQLRFRQRGTDGGHNGLKSIIDRLGTNGFPRLRIGIGRPGLDEDPAAYVLNQFCREETKKLPGIIQDAADGCESWIREGIENVMNIYNKRKDDE